MDLARNVQKTFRKDKVILVGTKYDLVPRDRSLCDNIIQSMPSEFAYFHDLKFCAVSTVTGEGINDLKTEICMSVSTLSDSVAKIHIHEQAEWYTHVIKAYLCSGCQTSSIPFLIVCSMPSHMPSHFRCLPMSTRMCVLHLTSILDHKSHIVIDTYPSSRWDRRGN